MKLSKHFSLKEVIKYETAVRKGIDNTPNIESSNPNDSSSIVAEATFNIA